MKRLRKEEGERAGSAPGVIDQEEESPDRAIICAACRHEITSEHARTTISGRHQHTCVNPSGIVYRIVCYRSAPGCVTQGEPTDFYSWFAGCSWQIALCERCAMHLGWAFTGASAFFGLIEDRVELRED